MRRFISTMAVLACAGTYALAANERATFILTSGERQSGTIVHHGGENNNLIDNQYNLGLDNGREKSFPASQVAVIDFAGGQPSAGELQQVPASGQFLALRNGQSQPGTLVNLVNGDTVIVSGLEKPVTALRIVNSGGRWTTENVWENPGVSLYMTNAVVAGDALFGMSHRNSGQFFWLDAKSGKTLWTSAPRQAGNAAIVRAGNLLFVLKDDAELLIGRANPSGFDPIKRYTVADSATWAMPVIVDNRIFVKDTTNLALWTW